MAIYRNCSNCRRSIVSTSCNSLIQKKWTEGRIGIFIRQNSENAVEDVRHYLEKASVAEAFERLSRVSKDVSFAKKFHKYYNLKIAFINHLLKSIQKIRNERENEFIQKIYFNLKMVYFLGLNSNCKKLIMYDNGLKQSCNSLHQNYEEI